MCSNAELSRNMADLKTALDATNANLGETNTNLTDTRIEVARVAEAVGRIERGTCRDHASAIRELQARDRQQQSTIDRAAGKAAGIAIAWAFGIQVAGVVLVLVIGGCGG